MPPKHCADLRCTQLCRHGPRHDDPRCRFSHSLSELMMPDETVKYYPDVWRLGHVHRWFGQVIDDDVMNIIRRYYAEGPVVDNRPVWAVGLCLMQHRVELCGGLAYPWDFGLSADMETLRILRRDAELPFRLYPDLMSRLQARKEVLSCSRVGSSVLGYNYPPPGYVLTHLATPAPPPARPEEPLGGVYVDASCSSSESMSRRQPSRSRSRSPQPLHPHGSQSRSMCARGSVALQIAPQDP